MAAKQKTAPRKKAPAKAQAATATATAAAAMACARNLINMGVVMASSATVLLTLMIVRKF